MIKQRAIIRQTNCQYQVLICQSACKSAANETEARKTTLTRFRTVVGGINLSVTASPP